ncbi:MAG: tail fiber domain-containing protein, partial [Candidatus Shapirobacteria bacterium]|nr:tail fiber domain-containing protein [Candidatus Shapirobacteria bacterium]
EKDDDGGSLAGQTYLILGKASGWAMDTDLSAANASFWGEDGGDQSGHAVSGAGDVNGDGYDDFIIGAYVNADGGGAAGQTYLILGKASGWAMDTDLSTADASFWGEDAVDWSGYAVSGVGDVNGDGYDDFIIGAEKDDDGGSLAGQTYLILGKASGWAMDTDLSAANASFWGEDADDSSGSSVSGVGDVNGDGYDDFIIGAYGDDDGGSSAGQTYLILSNEIQFDHVLARHIQAGNSLSIADLSFYKNTIQSNSSLDLRATRVNVLGGLTTLGNVGIGTTAPLAKLHINTGTNQSTGSTSFSATSSGATGTTQVWIVPETRTYTIDVAGAAGGYAGTSGYPGGSGARMVGDFVLSAGDTLSILVGQQGTNNNASTRGGGGGGGTFILNQSVGSTALLMAAGGGGGGGNYTAGPGIHGQIGTSGAAGTVGTYGIGGTNGGGGNSGQYTGGGAGWKENGVSSAYGIGGTKFPTGTGGAGYSSDGGVAGGYGGGGGSYAGGGGGGGYSGGGGGGWANSGDGGGGGSYNAGANQANTGAYKTGNGSVSITWEPTSVAAIFNGGRIGVNTTAPSYTMTINGTGYLSSAAWIYGSDRRIKENIQYYSDENINALDIIGQLKPASFDYITGSKNEDGFIAQDIQSILPNLVTTDNSGMLGLKTTNLIPYLVKAIQEQQVQISDLSADLSITQTGQININYNISESVLSSLGYNDSKNEIESAQYNLNDSLGNQVTRIAQFGQIFVGKIQTGLLSATNIITKNAVIENLVARQSKIDSLKTDLISPLSGKTVTIDGDATISGSLAVTDIQTTAVDTQDLTAKTATISTIYADNIISREGSFGEIMTQKIASLREELKKFVLSSSDVGTSSPIFQGGMSVGQGGFLTSIASDSAHISGDLSLSNNLIVGAQLTVQGDTQLGNAFITGTFTTGEIAIKDNFIETTNAALFIQPSAIGSVHILGDTLVIADTGDVVINGNLNLNGTLTAQTASISGSLFGQLISAIDASVSGTLTANNVKASAFYVATDSAQIIIAQSGFAQLATSSAELSSNATAGTATLPAGKTEIIIHTNKLTPNSMVYLTPNGSTKNQVVYVKSKNVVETPDLASLSKNQSTFVIALDNPLTSPVDINWWIIN